jgi:tetraacyldisaccharide 4'-kinase
MNPFLSSLAVIYGRASSARSAAYRHGWLKRRRLNRPVISIGNLTVGGTGKTPLVAYVARLLLKRGFKPSILTRGYRRSRGPSLVVLEPSSSRSLDPREVGDEPALLATALPEVPIVVCTDRYRGGLVAEERFQVNVHLLDDGFQRLQLARDVDIVALDVTQELSDRALLPAGRQREPVEALRRAHLVVLTRVELGGAERLEQIVGERHPGALLFHGRTRLRALRSFSSGQEFLLESLEARPVCAFCGIGNPRAFFRNLRQWGFHIVGEHAFPDHHVYSERDVASLVLSAREAGALTLMTTEKDFGNLPADWRADLNAYACIIETEIEEQEAFERALFARLENR